MKMKKLCAVLLTAAMVVSVTGCGASSNTTAQSESVVAENTAVESESEKTTAANTEGEAQDTSGNYGGLVPMEDADDPVTYTVFVRDPGVVPSDDNPVIKKIQELTGVTLKFEFLVGDLDQKLGVMIAGGDYPDVIFAGDKATKLMDAGAFIPLEDEIPKYPNLNAMYSQTMDYLKQADGHVYNMEIYGTLKNDVTEPAPIFECGLGFFIQKAVLAEAGYPTIRTVEEYFQIIEDYLAKYPEIDGIKTSGFEILADGWRNWALLNPVQNLMGAGNDGAIYVDQKTYETSFFQISDDSYNFYKKLNDEYKKGVINAETFTQDYDQYISKITTGSVLGFYDQNWNFSGAQNLLKADGKNDRTYVALPITNPGVTDGYLDKSNGIPTGTNGIGITINCENPERLLRFYDWLLQREVQDYLQWGEEGKDWNLTEDGGKALTDERRAIVYDTARNRDETGFTLWNYCPKWQGVYTEDGMPCGTGESADEYLASQSDYDKQFLDSYNMKYPAEMFSDPIIRPNYYPVWAMTLEDGSAAAVASTKITDVTMKFFPRLILADDEAEYDTIWNEFLGEFNAIDLNSYQAEIDRQIAEKMSK
ncbi:hypothetical protein [Eisenbergiella sp.]